MNETQDKLSPDKIINQGIWVLCAVLGSILALFLRVTELVHMPPTYDFWIGVGGGLIIGSILCKLRPRYGQEQSGIWKRVNHFVLTQMDLESAFSRKKQ